VVNFLQFWQIIKRKIWQPWLYAEKDIRQHHSSLERDLGRDVNREIYKVLEKLKISYPFCQSDFDNNLSN
jgi:hypothetical protein